MKRFLFSMLVALVLVLSWVIPVMAAETQDVTIDATPAYVTIANAPGSNDFSTVEAGVDEETANDFFTITNGSTVTIDIDIKCNGWSSGGSAWTYGTPAENQGQLKASSGEGGTGGSQGSGLFDITILNGSDTLFCDDVATITNPQWEIQIDVPSSFTHGDAQQSTVTLTASPA